MQKQHKKHIVFLRRLPETQMWGGLEKLMMDWFDHIDFSACRVTLGISPGGKRLFAERLEQKGFPIEIIEFPSDFKGNKTWKLFCQTFKFLKPLKADSIIFVQGDFTDFQVGEVAAGFCFSRQIYAHENLGVSSPEKKASKRYFGIIPGVGLWWYMQRISHFFRGLLLKNSLVVSREIKEQLTKEWNYSAHKVTVAYHGVDLAKYKILPEKRKLGRQQHHIPADSFVFILTARLAEVKRIDRAINAFGKIAQNDKNIWLLIVGDGHLRGELEALAQQQSAKDRILFLGHRENIPDYLNMADCYVNSSDVEGICIAMLEALACGLIGIATTCPGTTEVLKGSQAGFLTEKSTEGVHGGMQKVLALDEAGRKQLTSRGLAFVNQHFELNQLVKHALDLMGIPNK